MIYNTYNLYIVNNGKHFTEEFKSDETYSDFIALRMAQEKYPNATLIFRPRKLIDYLNPDSSIVFRTGNKESATLRIGTIIGFDFFNTTDERIRNAYFIYSSNQIYYINNYDIIDYYRGVYWSEYSLASEEQNLKLTLQSNTKQLLEDFIKEHKQFIKEDPVNEYLFAKNRNYPSSDPDCFVKFIYYGQEYEGTIVTEYTHIVRESHVVSLYSTKLEKYFYLVSTDTGKYFVCADDITVI